MKLRHRLRDSPLLVGLVARLFYGWLRLCHATTRWTIEGREELDAALAEGPVIVVLWHEHLMMALMHWRHTGRPLMSLHDTSPIGRVAGAMEARAGLTPIAMSAKTGNLATSRRVKREMANSVSLGVTADGPEGPARLAKTAPLEWARSTGAPVFLYANGMKRQRRLDTWDKMVFPLPFTKGVGVFLRWEHKVPRKITDSGRESLRCDLEAALTALAHKADAASRSL